MAGGSHKIDHYEVLREGYRRELAEASKLYAQYAVSNYPWNKTWAEIHERGAADYKRLLEERGLHV